VNSGKPTIVEKGIAELIHDGPVNKRISATACSASAVANSDVSFICVGTPNDDNGHLDLTVVSKVVGNIVSGMKQANKGYHIVCVRSTVVPGTTRKLQGIIDAGLRETGLRCDLVINPEFLREGSAVADYFDPPYTLVGSDSEKAVAAMKELYKGIDAPIKVETPEVAEVMKLVNNTFHALKIVFANEVGNICGDLGIDSHRVMDLFVLDRKLNISSYYFRPGFAYGGSCLPKDLKALNTVAHDLYLDVPVIRSIQTSNDLQKMRAIDYILNTGAKSVGILGFSFKAGTDDLRNSPIVDVAERLLGKGIRLKIYDKHISFSNLRGINKTFIMEKIPQFYELLCSDIDDVIGSSELVVIANKEKEFQRIADAFPDKRFYDLVRIDGMVGNSNYEGINWGEIRRADSRAEWPQDLSFADRRAA